MDELFKAQASVSDKSRSGTKQIATSRKCCICGTRNFTPKASYHRFPNDKKFSDIWAQKTNLKFIINASPAERYRKYRVCSVHFSAENYVGPSKRVLKKNAIPNAQEQCIRLNISQLKQSLKKKIEENVLALTPELTTDEVNMPTSCCIPGCKSFYKHGRVKTFRFPNSDKSEKHKQMFNDWLKAIPRENWKPSKRTSVCIEHFKEEDIIKEDILPRTDGSTVVIPRQRYKVAIGAVPCIFPSLLPNSSLPLAKASSTSSQRTMPHNKRLQKNTQLSELNSNTVEGCSKSFEVKYCKKLELSEAENTFNSFGITNKKEVQDISGCIQPILDSSIVQIKQEVLDTDEEAESTSNLCSTEFKEKYANSDTETEHIKHFPDKKMGEEISNLDGETFAHSVYNLPGLKIKKELPYSEDSSKSTLNLSGIQMEQEVADHNNGTDPIQNLSFVETQKAITYSNTEAEPNMSDRSTEKVTRSYKDDISNFNLLSVRIKQEIPDSDEEIELTLNQSREEIEEMSDCESAAEKIIYSSSIEIKQELSDSDSLTEPIVNSSEKNFPKSGRELQLKLSLSKVETGKKILAFDGNAETTANFSGIGINQKSPKFDGETEPAYILPDVSMENDIPISDNNAKGVAHLEIKKDIPEQCVSNIDPFYLSGVKIKQEILDSEEETEQKLNFPRIENEKMIKDSYNNVESTPVVLGIEIKRETLDSKYSAEPSTSSAGMEIEKVPVINNDSIGKTSRQKKKRKTTKRLYPPKRRKGSNKSCKSCSELTTKLQMAENKLKYMSQSLDDKDLQISALKEEVVKIMGEIADLEKEALSIRKPVFTNYKFTYTGSEMPPPRNRIPINFFFAGNKLMLPKPNGTITTLSDNSNQCTNKT